MITSFTPNFLLNNALIKEEISLKILGLHEFIGSCYYTPVGPCKNA